MAPKGNTMLNGYNNFNIYDTINNMPRDFRKDYEYAYYENEKNLEKARRLYHRIKKLETEHDLTSDETTKDIKKTLIRNLMNEINQLDVKEMKSFMDISLNEIYEFFNEKPFRDCFMYNISPKWNGGIGGVTGVDLQEIQIKALETAITLFYKDQDRFTKMKYVIECGKDGGHIHAHCVMELNPELKRSNEGWRRKGRDLQEFRNIWDKLMSETDNYGDVSPVKVGKQWKNFALQCNVIRNKRVLQDKLDYLIEEKKPFSHQNAEHPLCPKLFNDGF
jgi:CxxC motif-containing protein